MKLYLIRHAESANNLLSTGEDNFEGRNSDPEITETGHRQAEILAQYLAHPQGETRQQPFNTGGSHQYGFTHLYCSLMTRSLLTAEYVAKACGLTQQALPDIYEQYGIYEYDERGQRKGLPGPDRSYFDQRFPEAVLPDALADTGWWNRPAETNAEFILRMRGVVANIKQRHADSDDCVAMVVHADFIDQFVNELMGVQRHGNNYAKNWFGNWAFHNTALSRVDMTADSHTVVYLNRIDHLPMNLLTY